MNIKLPIFEKSNFEICNYTVDPPYLPVEKINQLDEQLQKHYDAIPDEYFIERADQLSREGYTKLTEILTVELMRELSREVVQIMDKSARRINIQIEVTDNSPRKMETINFDAISKLGVTVPALYYSNQMREFLSLITRHHVYDCPYDSERLTGTRQTRAGDTHGWHWGDHQYALIFIIKAPEIDCGGMLQCVPHTTWNKENARIHEILAECEINTYYHATGEIYFFKTDTTLHRTYPLEKDCERIILNFTFSGPNDMLKSNTHETMTAIFDFE